MGDERSRPNWVAQKKYEAIDYWDQEAKQRIKEGKHVRAFGNWAMMQLAKLHAESPAGLALDVASLGTGGLLVKGVQGTARMVKGAKAIQSAKTLVEIDRTLKPVRAAAGITRPLVTTKHKVLEGIGKAAATVEDVAPKFIQPVAVAGQKTLTPRRALKTVSKAVMGAKTESKLGGGGAGGSTVAPLTTKPMRSVLEVGPNTPLDPKFHWVFPAEVKVSLGVPCRGGHAFPSAETSGCAEACHRCAAQTDALGGDCGAQHAARPEVSLGLPGGARHTLQADQAGDHTQPWPLVAVSKAHAVGAGGGTQDAAGSEVPLGLSSRTHHAIWRPARANGAPRSLSKRSQQNGDDRRTPDVAAQLLPGQPAGSRHRSQGRANDHRLGAQDDSLIAPRLHAGSRSIPPRALR